MTTTTSTDTSSDAIAVVVIVAVAVVVVAFRIEHKIPSCVFHANDRVAVVTVLVVGCCGFYHCCLHRRRGRWYCFKQQET